MSVFRYAVVTIQGTIVSRHKTEKTAERYLKESRATARRVMKYSTKDQRRIKSAGISTYNRIIKI